MPNTKDLPRKQTIHHPSGETLDTPLLIPSFSSKGLSLASEKGKIVCPDLEKFLAIVKETIYKPILVSAFDLHHGFIKESYLKLPNILFIDSGGYETLGYILLAEKLRQSLGWGINIYKKILDGWDSNIPAVFVSFDYDYIGQPIESQIKLSEELLYKYAREQMITILLKPDKLGELLNIQAIVANITKLANFDFIGIPEKELGSSILKKLINVAKIRKALDYNGINAPIHIFGSLDPVSAILYFLAGAEIFDGLTWMKYAYYNGTTIYKDNYKILELGINGFTDNNIKNESRILVDNINYLNEMSFVLRCFVDKKNNYKILSPYYKKIKEIHETFLSELGG